MPNPSAVSTPHVRGQDLGLKSLGKGTCSLLRRVHVVGQFGKEICQFVINRAIDGADMIAHVKTFGPGTFCKDNLVAIKHHVKVLKCRTRRAVNAIAITKVDRSAQHFMGVEQQFALPS